MDKMQLEVLEDMTLRGVLYLFNVDMSEVFSIKMEIITHDPSECINIDIKVGEKLW